MRPRKGSPRRSPNPGTGGYREHPNHTTTVPTGKRPTSLSIQSSELAADAVELVRRGFSVLPLATRAKEPNGRLVPHGVYDASSDPDRVAAWWCDTPDGNIGIATGRASGVFVVDMDPRNGGCQSLATLVHQFGALPETATVTTGGPDGGRHFYFAYPGSSVRNIDLAAGVQIKGDGAYVVAPCSVHPSGHAYAGELDRPRIAVASDWLLALLRTEDTSKTQALHVSASDCDPMELVVAAIDLTIPKRIGFRNRRLFDFARRLKGIPGFAALDADDLRWAFDRWFARALPNIGTRDVAESWKDFCIAWSNVAFPFGSELRGVLRAAGQSPPAGSQRYDGAIYRLACLCAGLAANDTGTFFLSCRTAGHLLGVGHTKAAAMLCHLARDGFIERVEPHTRRRAAVFRLRTGVGNE